MKRYDSLIESRRNNIDDYYRIMLPISELLKGEFKI